MKDILFKYVWIYYNLETNFTSFLSSIWSNCDFMKFYLKYSINNYSDQEMRAVILETLELTSSMSETLSPNI